ncbi:MAG: hypothetical protein P4L51_23720 [Puia sp.]|nr:hypothetical protein [Puia sp.]
MKKIINISLLALTFSTTGIYSLTFKTPDGNSVSLSTYAGNKMVIVVFNPTDRDFTELKMLDSVYRDFPTVHFIAVPGIDFATGQIDSVAKIQDSSISVLKANLGLSIAVTEASFVKKFDTLTQHPILQWCTHQAQNTHFDRDVEAEGQLFFVNESGVLYSVMPKETSKAQIEQILNTTIIQ